MLAYVAYHVSSGALAIGTSAWMGTVLACPYLAMRERSRWAAMLNAACIRWTFIAYALVAVGGLDRP